MIDKSLTKQAQKVVGLPCKIGIYRAIDEDTEMVDVFMKLITDEGEEIGYTHTVTGKHSNTDLSDFDSHSQCVSNVAAAFFMEHQDVSTLAVLDKVFVEPKWRKKGIGTFLISATINKFLNKCVTLCACPYEKGGEVKSKKRKRELQFYYENLGFQRIAQETEDLYMQAVIRE